MNKLTSATSVARTASLIGLLAMTSSLSFAAPGASATPAGTSTAMPMTAQWRACDASPLKWVKAQGYARPVAHVGTNGAGDVVATVDIATAAPGTLYQVRVIQTPRPTNGCEAGAPGVLTGGLQTDANGAGSTTVQGPAAKGATGAWVVVELPSEYAQTPAEFYTSEFIAAI
jgi:hypothetical protein